MEKYVEEVISVLRREIFALYGCSVYRFSGSFFILILIFW